jgi:hypothetical protein
MCFRILLLKAGINAFFMLCPFFIDTVFFSLQLGREKGAFCALLLQGNPRLESDILHFTIANLNYITLIKDTAMKHHVRSENIMKVGHTPSDHKDIRNAKLELHIQNLP